MGRPKPVYRGKRKYGWIITLLLFVLAAVLIAGVWLFYDLQKYIEYEKDDLRLVMDKDEEENSSPAEEVVTADPVTNPQVVIAMPDLEGVENMVTSSLEPIKAMYVKAENIKAETLAYYPGIIAESEVEYNALVLSIKDEEGFLSYFSTVPLTASYGVNGTEILDESLAMLSEKNIRLVAELSCLADSAMAQRNSPIALRDVSGNVLTNEQGSWLDPYNPSVREYISDLMAEIAKMGFDEILFTGMSFPNMTAQFSQAMTAAPDGLSSIAALAKYLRLEADELGICISAVIDGKALREGSSASVGQDAEFFLKVFDRVYLDTDFDHYISDAAILAEFAGEAAASRVVTMVEGFTPASDSFFTK